MTDENPTIFAPIWKGDRAVLAKAFVAAQKATEAVKKAASNPAFKSGNKESKYADLAHVVEAVMPALNNAGVGVIQFPSFDGQMVNVTTTMIHESGASVTAILSLRPSKLDPQGVGSAITYGRRYSLLAMTGVAPEDDDGNAASGPVQETEPKRVEPPKPTLADRADRFEATLKACKSAPDLAKAFKLGSGLMADLDAKDPERFEMLNKLHEHLEGEFIAPKLEAAE